MTAVLAVPGCKKDEPKPEPVSAEPAAVAEAPAGPAQSEYHESTFDVVIRPVPPFSAGKPGTVEIQLDAKGEYHMNDSYPYRFKAHPSEGVTYSAPSYTKDAMKLEAARGTMKIEVTPQSPGEKAVSGLFLFSVCSAERCLVEKRELTTKLAVAAAN
jgi:hypothetical protein